MKSSVNEITKEDFREALETVLNGKVTTIAPLGFSGDQFYLYDNPTMKEDGIRKISWSGCVTIRTWSDMPELLIGNKAGRWLCHLKIDRIMGFDYILNEFHRQFENTKHLIDKFDRDEKKVEVSEDVGYAAGFKILELAQRAIDSTEQLSEAEAEQSCK